MVSVFLRALFTPWHPFKFLMNNTQPSKAPLFTRYQIFMIVILSIIQFTVVLDFMVLSPLGEQLMAELKITPAQFSRVVSAYAIFAGISGLLTAGFADKFDRKKLLLFFYTGFVIGTFLCAVAPNYNFLLMARIVTGIFGGVIGSIGFAIVADIFKPEVRGRVMGFTQMAFSASQILGLPVGLLLAAHYGWHAPFSMIVIATLLVGVVVIIYMKPIDAHLKIKNDRNALMHLFKTITHKSYLRAFLATTLLSTGGFMLMPFGSDFSVHNLGIQRLDLWKLYGVTGISSIILGPLIGKLSDRIGRFKMFMIGTIISGAMVAIYTPMGITPLWLVIIINVVLFAGIMSRIISSSALMTSIPELKDRGAFMSINSSVSMISGGFAAFFAGLIVVRNSDGSLLHYERLGYVVLISMLVAMVLIYVVDKHAKKMALKKVHSEVD
jgi:predicted MFS family arabinose efflux permease